jgi:hypothetical protein
LHIGTPWERLCVSGSPGAALQVSSSWHSLPRSPGLSSGSLLGTHLTVQHFRERGVTKKNNDFCYYSKATAYSHQWLHIALTLVLNSWLYWSIHRETGCQTAPQMVHTVYCIQEGQMQY